MQAKPKPKSRRDKTGAEEMNEFIEKKKKKERTIELQSKLQLVCKKAKASAGIFSSQLQVQKLELLLLGRKSKSCLLGQKLQLLELQLLLANRCLLGRKCLLGRRWRLGSSQSLLQSRLRRLVGRRWRLRSSQSLMQCPLRLTQR